MLLYFLYYLISLLLKLVFYSKTKIIQNPVKMNFWCTLGENMQGTTMMKYRLNREAMSRFNRPSTSFQRNLLDGINQERNVQPFHPTQYSPPTPETENLKQTLGKWSAGCWNLLLLKSRDQSTMLGKLEEKNYKLVSKIWVEKNSKICVKGFTTQYVIKPPMDSVFGPKSCTPEPLCWLSVFWL